MPNILLDEWLPKLSPAEMRVMLCLCRFTFGFHRRTVEMGMRLMADRTGLQLCTVSDAVGQLQQRGLIRFASGLRGRRTYEITADCSENQNSGSSDDCSENQNSQDAISDRECSENQNGHCSENQNTTVRKIRTRERKDLKKEKETTNGAKSAPGNLIDHELKITAKRIWDRHPPVRKLSCSLTQVETLLRAILKRHARDGRTSADVLSEVDKNHAEMCKSPQWEKENGEFAKGLDNYLAPTKDRYLISVGPILAQPTMPNGRPPASFQPELSRYIPR